MREVFKNIARDFAYSNVIPRSLQKEQQRKTWWGNLLEDIQTLLSAKDARDTSLPSLKQCTDFSGKTCERQPPSLLWRDVSCGSKRSWFVHFSIFVFASTTHKGTAFDLSSAESETSRADGRWMDQRRNVAWFAAVLTPLSNYSRKISTTSSCRQP
jgi:hypothetical protein